MRRFLKYVFLTLSFIVLGLWGWFVFQPYLVAWELNADVVSESFWPNGALRDPVVNGKSLVYLQKVNEDSLVFREILVTGDTKDYDISTNEFLNVKAIYFSQDLSVINPIVILWGESKSNTREYLISIYQLGKAASDDFISPYPLSWVRAVTDEYILAQITVKNDGMNVNSPIILNWRTGYFKPLPIAGKTTQALSVISNNVYYSQSGFLYKVSVDGTDIVKLIDFPETANNDNWILNAAGMKLIWRSFDEHGANFTVYNIEANERSYVANGFKQWVPEYSVSQGKVIFSSSRTDGGKLDIFSVDVSTGNVSHLLDAEGDQHSPYILGEYMYWEERIDNPLRYLIAVTSLLGIDTWYSIHRNATTSYQSYIFRTKTTKE